MTTPEEPQSDRAPSSQAPIRAQIEHEAIPLQERIDEEKRAIESDAGVVAEDVLDEEGFREEDLADKLVAESTPALEDIAREQHRQVSTYSDSQDKRAMPPRGGDFRPRRGKF